MTVQFRKVARSVSDCFMFQVDRERGRGEHIQLAPRQHRTCRGIGVSERCRPRSTRRGETGIKVENVQLQKRDRYRVDWISLVTAHQNVPELCLRGDDGGSAGRGAGSGDQALV